MRILLSILSIFIINIAVAAPKQLLPIEHWTTPEGTRVYFVRAPEIPMIDIQVAFAAGSARDGKQQEGIAYLTNQMLTEGAGKLNADQIALGFESVGARLGQSVNRDIGKIQLRSLTAPEPLKSSLELLTQLLSNPTFPTTGFERQKKRLLSALKEQEQNPGTVASNAIWQTLYGDHPYAHSPLGNQQAVNDLTQEMIKSFFKTYYVAENAVITLVGAIDRKQAESIAATISSRLNRGKSAAVLSGVTDSATGIKQIVYPSTQTHIRSGIVAMSVGDPDFFALSLGNHILGGKELVSRLFKEVRNKRGLSYGVRSAFLPLSAPGPFMIELQTRADQTKLALDVVQMTIDDFINKGPTPTELAAAKKDIAGGFALRINSNAAISEQLTYIGFYQLPLDYLDTYVDNIDKVTIEQIHDAFKRRIVPQRFSTILVGTPSTDAKKPAQQ